ncbi:acyl carrier protein [Streptomyces sp. Ncost-T6T-1]|uniref:acyl carrier protein n=1 Tax=Streptomyces sp. Ncost-T6T-1 TaxID=1100828 RepID=UPI000805A229|nr:acyl carrier protein [Streptomyces sp. Ncost-T6T-1]SBU98619.1 acyl carrier protein [Streptomyces sp. Ncost-T6T-1]
MLQPADLASVRAFVERELIDFGAEPDAITDEARLGELQIDSLGVVELTASIKREFAVDVPLEALTKDVTVAEIVALIRAEHLPTS